MQHIITKAKSKPFKIHPIKKTEYTETLAEQSEYIKRFTQTSRLKGDPGDIYYIRNQEGGIEEILYITEDVLSTWSFASLPKLLPEGEYEIEGELSKREATDVVVGWQLGTYRYSRYKKYTDEFAKLIAPKNADLDEAEKIVNAINFARDLINLPASEKGPKELAQIASNLAHEFKASSDVLVDEELLQEGYESIYTVGKGSSRRPRLVDIRWGDPSDPKVTIIGKGVCFDTGGYNIKHDAGMLLMKKDMGGAAIVMALAQLIMKSKLNVNLRVMLPFVENSISGDAMRPSDVIRTRAGISVEVTNTDAEGRLILCEPLAEADSEKPELIIDMATLTGAARTAVGTDIAAFFTQDDKLAKEIEDAARDTGDPVWRLPLWEGYKPMLKSKIADLVNSPDSGYGGAITAALFLKEFVKETKSWVHFDLHAWNARDAAGRPIGGEAMALRTLYALLKKRYS